MSFFNEANNYYSNKNYEKALEKYNEAILNNENKACSYYNSGVCFIKLKDYDKALSMLKEALSIQKDSKYFFNIGYCYAMKDNYKKALIYFNKSWALNNEDKDCERAINLLLANQLKK